jgi:hypothetical protein
VQVAALSGEQGLPECGPVREDSRLSAEHCVHGSSPRRVYLWGDSHAKALAGGLVDVFNVHDLSVVSLVRPACTPVQGWNVAEPGCETYRKTVSEYLASIPVGAVVVVHGRWVNLLGHHNFDNGLGGTELGKNWIPRLAGFPGTDPSDPAYVATVKGQLSATFRPLLEAGRRVILVYDVPPIGWNVPDYRARAMLFGVADPPLDVDQQRGRQWRAPTDAILDSLGEHQNLLRVYPDDALCGRERPGRCPATRGDDVLYVDDNHISRAAAREIAASVYAAMAEKGWV